MLAVKYGHEEISKILVEAGSDIKHMKNLQGRSAYTLASHRARIILESGIQVL